MGRVEELLAQADLAAGEGRYLDAVATYDLLIEITDASSNAASRAITARALWRKGTMLIDDLGLRDQGLAALDEVVSRFGQDRDVRIRSTVAMALISQGPELSDLGRVEEAIAAYDSIVQRLDTAPEPELVRHVATALRLKSAELVYLGREQEALDCLEECLQRLRAHEAEPELRDSLVRAAADHARLTCT
jgi:tetratricopeptide (TPR) repeat protein